MVERTSGEDVKTKLDRGDAVVTMDTLSSRADCA